MDSFVNGLRCAQNVLVRRTTKGLAPRKPQDPPLCVRQVDGANVHSSWQPSHRYDQQFLTNQSVSIAFVMLFLGVLNKLLVTRIAEREVVLVADMVNQNRAAVQNGAG